MQIVIWGADENTTVVSIPLLRLPVDPVEMEAVAEAVADAQTAAGAAAASASTAAAAVQSEVNARAALIADSPQAAMLGTDPDGNIGFAVTDRGIDNPYWRIEPSAGGDLDIVDPEGFVGWRFPRDGSPALGQFTAPATAPVLPVVTAGTGLHAFRAKVARAKAGVASQVAKVVLTGDSWTEWRVIAGVPISERLWSAYGQSGTGWLGLYADESGEQSQLVGNARLVRAGTWTRQDMVAGVSLSPDGYAFDTSDTAATITITQARGDRIRWFYRDGQGAFRYSLDGAAAVTVTCGNTGAVLALDLSGLSAGDHSLTITHTTTTAVMRHYGGYATMGTTGVEFSKCGNGGSYGGQWQTIAPGISSVISAAMAPDLVMVILGTNDARLSYDAEQYEAGIRALIAAWRAASPTCGFILCLPPECGPAAGRDALYRAYHARLAEIAGDTAGVDILSLYDFWPSYAVSNAQGLWSNNLHPNLSGGNVIAGLAMKLLEVK